MWFLFDLMPRGPLGLTAVVLTLAIVGGLVAYRLLRKDDDAKR